MLYKTKHKETQRKQNISQSTSKNEPLKATMSQSHDVPKTKIECRKRWQESVKSIGHIPWKGSKISKNAALGRFGGVLASTRYQDRKEASARLRTILIYVKKMRFWDPPKTHWILKGFQNLTFST